MSKFAVTGRSREKPEMPEGDMDPRMERAMAEMEREMASLDEGEPDPRQLGRMMRKLTDAAGEKVPDIMRQMIGRLERGEDLAKLEAEYGTSLEEWGAGEIDGNDEAGRHVATRVPPQRDPTLYEMSDYTPKG